MVAKASWLTVEPQISLRAYLAGEETAFLSPTLDWLPSEWATGEDDVELQFSEELLDDSE